MELLPGEVLNINGEVIGRHDGSLIYTIGQRQGFHISTHEEHRAVYYVVGKDTKKNTITVHTEKPVLHDKNLLVLHDIELRTKLTAGETCEAQTRYRQKPFLVKVLTVEEDKLILEVLQDTEAAASGQSCVLYRGSLCLGGGIIA